MVARVILIDAYYLLRIAFPRWLIALALALDCVFAPLAGTILLAALVLALDAAGHLRWLVFGLIGLVSLLTALINHFLPNSKEKRKRHG